MLSGKLILAICLFVYSTQMRAGATILDPIDTGKDTLVRFPEKPKKVARVRLGVEITPFNRILVTGKSGKQKHSYAKSSPVKRNLKSRIDKITHFYINRWHIELQPTSWNKSSMNLKYQARLYKQYGTRRELEEQVGSFEIAGVLEGKNFLYRFHGKKKVKFTDKLGNPLVAISFSEPHKPSKSLNIARAAE